MKIEEMSNAQRALLILIHRNELRHDGDAYEELLAAWGVGLVDTKPTPSDFLQYDEPSDDELQAIIDFYNEEDDESL